MISRSIGNHRIMLFGALTAALFFSGCSHGNIRPGCNAVDEAMPESVTRPVYQAFMDALPERRPSSHQEAGEAIFTALPEAIRNHAAWAASMAETDSSSRFDETFYSNLFSTGFDQVTGCGEDAKLDRFAAMGAFINAAGRKWGAYDDECLGYCIGLSGMGVHGSSNQLWAAFTTHMAGRVVKGWSSEEVLLLYRTPEE